MTVARLSTSTAHPILRRPTGLRAAASHLGLALIVWSHRGSDRAVGARTLRRRAESLRDAELAHDRAVAAAMQVRMH